MSVDNDTNVTETTDYCPYYDQTNCRGQYDALLFVVYSVVSPCYAILGVSGHVILLLAMLMQAKQQSPYVYQLMVVTTETLMDLTVTLYVACWMWLYNYDWFQHCRFCMWFTYNISTLLPNTLLTNLLLMAVVIAVDRLFALKKPVTYKSFRHGRIQVSVVVVGLAISIGTSAFDYFRYNMYQMDDGRFYHVVNDQFVVSPVAVVMSHLRSVIRVTAGVLLLVINVALVHSYRRHRAQIGLTLSKSDKQRTGVSEKTLILLTVTQSVSSILQGTIMTIFYALQYSSLADCECIINTAAALTDALLELIEPANFYLCMAFSKQFRQMIRASLRSFGVALSSTSIKSLRGVGGNSG